jgi:hypothetical protein
MYNKRGFDSPSPTAYNPPSSFDKKNFGTLIGPRPCNSDKY